jgi:hypothetical protein
MSASRSGRTGWGAGRAPVSLTCTPYRSTGRIATQHDTIAPQRHPWLDPEGTNTLIHAWAIDTKFEPIDIIDGYCEVLELAGPLNA